MITFSGSYVVPLNISIKDIQTDNVI